MTLTAGDARSVLGHRDRVIDALETAHRVARTTVDPALLEVCEHRVAELLRLRPGPAPEPDLDPDLRAAAIALTEQWMIDVAAITDELIAAVARHLGDDALMDFLHGLLVVEQRLRLATAWRALGLLDDEAPV
jgi:hypothetical protein